MHKDNEEKVQIKSTKCAHNHDHECNCNHDHNDKHSCNCNHDKNHDCNCSKERVEKAVASVGKKDLQEMIEEGKSIEVNCHFCDKKYEFTVEDLKNLMKYSK